MISEVSSLDGTLWSLEWLPSLTWCGSKRTFTTPSRTSSLSLMIWLCMIAHRRGNPTALMIFSWKLQGITSWKDATGNEEVSFRQKRRSPSAQQTIVCGQTPGHLLRLPGWQVHQGKGLPIQTWKVWQRKRRRQERQVQVQVRGTSRSLSPVSRNQVCKFWKAGKCQRGSECAFQHPPKPAAPSTKDDKRGKSQNKKKKNKKKGDRSRSSSRGSNSSKGSQSLKDSEPTDGPTGGVKLSMCHRLSTCLSVYPSIHPSILLFSLLIYLSVNLSISVSFHPFCLPFYLSRQQSIHHPISVYVSICLSFSLLLSSKICPFPCLSICLSSCGLSIYLAVYLLTHLGTEAFHPSI